VKPPGHLISWLALAVTAAAACGCSNADRARSAQAPPLPPPSFYPGYSTDQQLIIACHHLDVDAARSLLAAGANVNARFNAEGDPIFLDKWFHGWPVAARDWTPLIALASSERHPDPEQSFPNTSAGSDEAHRQIKLVPQAAVDDRNQRRMAIARMLLARPIELDNDDGYGGTALYEAVYKHYEDLALFLIAAGADVNKSPGVYIDGASGITPLHRAVGMPLVVKALVARKANLDARDSTGETPLHWAARYDDMEIVRLLIEAGADVTVKDREGRTPLSRISPSQANIEALRQMQK